SMRCSRGSSRCRSAIVLGGIGSPPCGRKCSRRSGAFLRLGLKLRMPSRASVALTRLTMVVCWPTRVSRSRCGRLASSSAMVGIAHILQLVRLTAEPAEEGAFELLGVQPVGLGAPVLPGHRHACGMDDMSFDATCPNPPSQHEAVPASFESDGNAVDLVACFLRFPSPALEEL